MYGDTEIQNNDASLELVIDTEQFTKNPKLDNILYIDSLTDCITGSISPLDAVNSIRYKITSSSGYIVSEGTIDKAENWKIEDIGLTYGLNTIMVTATALNGNEKTETIEVYNACEDNLDNIVVDSQDIQKYVDEILALDSDGDGVCDYHEKEILFTDPFDKDTDRNGISDGDEDFDTDGLSNSYELKNGTNPFETDSDFDELNDYDEVNLTLTNPSLYDTDGDGASDKWEIDNGYDPLVFNNQFQIEQEIQLGNNITSVSVELVNADGIAVDTLSVEPFENCLISSSVPGYIDSATEFITEGAFEKAIVTYTLNPVLFNNREFVPALYYFNEETQGLERVEEQTLHGNIVTAELEHFSVYILLNEPVHFSVFDNSVEYIDPASVASWGTDYIIVVDSSSSMKHSEVVATTELLDDIFNRMSVYDRCTLIECDETPIIHETFTSNTQNLKNSIDKLDFDGDCYYLSGINKAIEVFSSDEYKYSQNNNKRCIIVLSCCRGLITTLDKLKSMSTTSNIPIYDVSIYPHYDIITNPYYNPPNRNDLYSITPYLPGINSSITTRVVGEANPYRAAPIVGTVSDYYESQITKGILRTKTGIRIGIVSPSKRDTDGDGLLDGEEIEVVRENDQVYVIMYSDPTRIDTDRDGIIDSKDPYVNRENDFTKLRDVLIIRNKQSYLARIVSNLPKWHSYYIINDEAFEYIGGNLAEYYTTIAVHHTARNQYESIIALEKNELKSEARFNGIPYHFIINGNGAIFEGKPLDIKGEAIYENNSHIISIALMGNFESSETSIKYWLKDAILSTPTRKQLNSLVNLYWVLETQYGIDIVGGHRDFTLGLYDTDCPGDILYRWMEESHMIRGVN